MKLKSRTLTTMGTAMALALIPATSAHALTTVYGSLAAFMQSHPGQTLIEDFESVMPKDAGLAFIETPTVRVNPIAGGSGAVLVASPGYDNFDPPGLLTTSSILTADGDEAFEVILASPSFAVGMDVYLNDLGPAAFSYFSGDIGVGSVIYPASPGNTINNRVFHGVFNADAPITRFTFVSTLGGRLNTGIDNIRTVPFRMTNGVPEPASWALMIAGFGAAGNAMRARQGRRGVLPAVG
jgi:hypothetical protein